MPCRLNKETNIVPKRLLQSVLIDIQAKIKNRLSEKLTDDMTGYDAAEFRHTPREPPDAILRLSVMV